MDRELNAASVSSQGGNRIHGVAVPFGISNGRPGFAWQIDDEGFPLIIEYAGTIYERDTFAEFLADEDPPRTVRFFFQHGDAHIYGSPNGRNALPIGRVTQITDTDLGLEFDAEFANHELAAAVRALVESGSLEEISIGVQIMDFDLRIGEDGLMYRHATRSVPFDISVVTHGQYGLNALITDLYVAAPHCGAFLGVPCTETHVASVDDSETNGTRQANGESVPTPLVTISDYETRDAASVRANRLRLLEATID